MKLPVFLGFIGLTLLLGACRAQPPIAQTRSDCVANYDRNRDYFPDKVKLTQAQGFTVEYHNNYKLINVNRPWKDAKVQFQYVLVQCGTPTPAGFKPEQVVQVPVRSVVALSTTHLVQLEKLGVLDRLVGVNDFKIVTTPAVLSKIQTNKLAEVGSPASPNVEKILELAPDLVSSYGTGNPQFDGYAKLIEAGLPVAIVSEYMESTPLGQAEWIKFLALFFNRETAAEQSFNQVERRYAQVAARVKSARAKPTVFAGFSNKGTWYVPGGDSYVAKLIKDAGANYIWADDRTQGNLNLSFEQVYDRANQAQYWINGSQKWQTRQAVIQDDRRYEQFASVQAGNLHSPILRVNAQGGNDYWQSGIANPDVILTDLVKVFHPELMGDHQFVYYKKLP
jgi:iron complex transport system substrate-binding protein